METGSVGEFAPPVLSHTPFFVSLSALESMVGSAHMGMCQLGDVPTCMSKLHSPLSQNCPLATLP